MSKERNYIVSILLAAAGSLISAASTFSTMTVSEVGALLDAMPVESMYVNARPATEPVSAGQYEPTCSPVDVNARDLITKVYGLVDSQCSRGECIDAVRNRISLTPTEEEGDLWLDSKDGYQLRYGGHMPEMSGMARFDDRDSIAEYCYFFVFPYARGSRDDSVRDQADFTGMLLQEMQDMGMPIGANPMTDDLMEVIGNYEGSDIDVRLLDQASAPIPDDVMAGASPEEGRFILMFIVTP